MKRWVLLFVAAAAASSCKKDGDDDAPPPPAGPVTVRVSVDSAGAQATGGDSRVSSISSDGRYVAFESDATNLVPGDTNGFADVFVHGPRF